jgi:focal adhesion kinase 1
MQEENIKKRLSVASLNDAVNENKVKPLISEKPFQTAVPRTVDPLSLSAPKPEAIDRKHDPVYLCTTNVVRAVMKLSSGVEKSQMDEYLDLVKTVGLELRTLLGTVDLISAKSPSQTHK